MKVVKMEGRFPVCTGFVLSLCHSVFVPAILKNLSVMSAVRFISRASKSDGHQIFFHISTKCE